MKIGIKQEKWLKALESGEYKQGKGQLCDEDGGHCCLGVAGRTMGLKFVLMDGETLSGYRIGGERNYLDRYEEIGLMDWAGHIPNGIKEREAKEYFPEITDAFGSGALSAINDRGATHKQIAHFIRENPDRVFTKSV